MNELCTLFRVIEIVFIFFWYQEFSIDFKEEDSRRFVSSLYFDYRIDKKKHDRKLRNEDIFQYI